MARRALYRSAREVISSAASAKTRRARCCHGWLQKPIWDAALWVSAQRSMTGDIRSMSPEAMWRNRYHEAGEQYLFGTEPLPGTPSKTAAGRTKGAVARRWRRQELGVDRRAGSRGHPSGSEAADRRRERLTSAPLQRFSRRQRFRQRRTAAAGGRRGLGRRRGGGRDDDTRKEIRPELPDRWREWTTRHLLRGTRFRKGSRFHTPSYMTGSNLT